MSRGIPVLFSGVGATYRFEQPTFMLPVPTPDDGDVVVRQEMREGALVYVLRVLPGPDQYLLHTKAEAVGRASAFAMQQHARAWLIEDGATFVLVEDFRDAEFL